MSLLGLHMRFDRSLQDLALRARRLGITFFQCFLVHQATGKLIDCDPDDMAAFIRLRRMYFGDLYLHASYRINLAGTSPYGHYALKQEVDLAKQLEFTHVVLHPGSAKAVGCRMTGIDLLARALNYWTKKEPTIRFVLENTAHGNFAVGSDITDFALLQQKIDAPELVSYCIDTSHAFAYGYAIEQEIGREQFIQLLHNIIGIERIAVIHLNDTKWRCGSRMDRHEVPGRGAIGWQALHLFAQHHKLHHLPLLMELPSLSEQQERQILDSVHSWMYGKKRSVLYDIGSY